jgi:hypothetical protein
MSGRSQTVRASLVVLAAVATLGAAPVAPLAGTADVAQRITPPKARADYSGRTDERKKLTLSVASRASVEIVAIEFACGRVTGRTSLQDIEIRKPSRNERAYRFGIRAYALVGYSDDRRDENGRVVVQGRFSRTAKTAEGWLRVESRRCGSSGKVDWRARERR